MKNLILINAQSDFVAGPLSVKKRTKETIEHIKIWINRNKEDLESIIFVNVLNKQNDPSFKCNGGMLPSHCVEWTPGACIEPTLLKLIHRLKIPYNVVTSPNIIEDLLYGDNDIVFAGINGYNNMLQYTVSKLFNVYHCYVLWPGTYIVSEDVVQYLRTHTEGIFEIPKRNKKIDLFVKRI